MKETATKPKGKIIIHEDLCKGCAFCIDACPKKILQMADHFNRQGYHPPVCTKPEECTGCALCYQICPEIAIEIERF